MHCRAICAVLGATFFLSLGLCVAVQHAAVRLRLVDVPNDRSLHKVPVPRLGGAALVVSLAMALGAGVLFFDLPLLKHGDTVALLAGASAIAILGLVDDLRPLPALARLVAQLCVSSFVLAFALRSSGVSVALGLEVHLPRAVALVAGVLFVVATTNIYNFMDGMDGLAAVQGIGVSLVIATACGAAAQCDLAVIGLAIAAGMAGFLVRNAPPASIFLGDAGSTFLGFTFSSLAVVAAERSSPVPFTVVPAALAPFLLDGTFTILRRLWRRQRVWQAHRTHLYQRAVATGLSSRRVLLIYVVWCGVSAIGALVISRTTLLGAILVAIGLAVPLALLRGLVAGREGSHP
ncbi:MAG TPA: glycosyltransferase family 4 protein [Polyangiaceae bacterium]